MIPEIVGVQFSDSAAGPLLLLGPSIGTSAMALWSECAAELAGRFQVVAWDLPGHGHNRQRATAPFTMADLAGGVLALADRVLAERGDPGGSFSYAGDSVGGAVALQIMLDAPSRITAAILLCTGAKIGDALSWRQRAERVRASGTSVMITQSAERWFASGFLERRPQIGTRLIDSLRDADAESYAMVCEALAGFDVRQRLAEIGVPVLAVVGAEDVATPPDLLRHLADGVQHGSVHVLDAVAHLAPAEAPREVAELIMNHVEKHAAAEDRYAVGMTVRREVLGDHHVDQATASTAPFSADFQRLITEYAWGTIWTRPGLDRRSRSMITLTALVARGHHEELALHLRAARRNGLTADEIKEVLLQTAIYCGVPAANAAFRIAESVLADGAETPELEENP